MMRRTRWLAAGAVLGALGYRRLQRAARSLTTETDQAAAAHTLAAHTSVAHTSVARQAASVVGVAASAAGHAVGVAGWLARQVRSGRAAGGVAGFVGDVRAGMDEYLDRRQANMNRQYRRSGNTLVGQRAPDRAVIAAGPGGRQRQDDETKDGR